MGRYSELEAELDNLARTTAGDDRVASRVRAALRARFGGDVAAWFAGRHDFYRGNLDAWKREDATHDPDRALGYRSTFSSDVGYVVDVDDNDDES